MGNTLLSVTSLYCYEKRKYLSFSLQFRINKLFTSVGGILVALHLFITPLIFSKMIFGRYYGCLTYCQDSSDKIILKFPLFVGILYEKL